MLVLGAGSGVGTAAIQIAKKMFGATVITTAGDEKKLEMARELGADYTIDHYKQKISDEVKTITREARSGHRVRACGTGDLGGEHEVAEAGRDDCYLRSDNGT